jgi:putative addiction module component (TIGR02574 family)
MDMNKSILSKVLQYDIPERILLVEDIWDSIAQCPEAIPVTDSQLKELDRRLEAYHRNPKLGSPWDVVKKRKSWLL